MADIIISGYHGFANSGDEALLFAILSTLRKSMPDIRVTVLSKTPEDTARAYGVNSIYRYNIFRIIKEMKNAKMLLFGGGSLLQDVTSSKSLMYYLGIIYLAEKCKLKTMLYANGIGPITKKRNRYLSSKILNKTDVITLRDDKSDEELRRLKVTKPDITITADPAFTINTDISMSGKYFTTRAGVPDGRKLCIVSIRSWKNASLNFEKDVAALCDYMVKKHGIYPLFVPMQYPDDMEISESIISRMETKAYIINRELSVAEMFSVLSEATLLIGMRLHSLIYATTLEIPAMALVYDPKISAFMQSLNQPLFADVENFDIGKAKEMLDALITENEERKRLLRSTNAILKKKAEENGMYAINLLNS